jgi:hypothetical protein
LIKKKNKLFLTPTRSGGSRQDAPFRYRLFDIRALERLLNGRALSEVQLPMSAFGVVRLALKHPRARDRKNLGRVKPALRLAQHRLLEL